MIDSCGTVRCVLCCSHDGREPRTGPGPVQQPLHPAHRHEYSNPSLCAGWRLPRQLCIHHTAGAIICWNYMQKCRSRGLCLRITVKSFSFVDTNNFCGLTTMDMFVDTWMCGFQVILNTTGVNIYFVGILNSWIVLPMTYTKLNVQQIKMSSQYMYIIYDHNVTFYISSSWL